MPAPSTSLATLRPDLSASLMEFNLAQDRQGFIGMQVLPVLEVGRAAGTFGRIPIEQLLVNRETRRAPGGGYSRSKFTFTTDSYATEENGHEEPVDDNEAQIYVDYFDAEQVAAQRAQDVVLRNAEKRIADLIFNATTWTGAALTTGITNEWDKNHLTDAVPIADVEAARLKVWTGCGLWPNALILNRKVFNNLRMLDDIKEAIASTGAGYPTRARDITVQQLASVFDLDYILVAGGAKNTAIEGQTLALSQIWSDEYAMICRLCTTGDIREPGLGRVMHYGADGSQVGALIETYRDETVRSDIVRARHQVDEKVLYIECGHLLWNVTT